MEPKLKIKNLKNEIGTAADLADLLGISSKDVPKLAASDDTLVRATGRGRFLLKQSVAGYCDHIRRAATGRESEAVIQRRRLLRCQADFAETRAKIESGTLVAATEVEGKWSGVLRTVRAMMMATPSRAAARVPNLSRHDVSELDTAVREALTIAADDTPENRRSNAAAASTTNPIPSHPNEIEK